MMSEPSLTASQRRWALAAAIGSVAVFGLGIGEVVPLLSLLLERRGTDATLNGLIAAAAFLGVIVGPLFVPRWLRAFGVRDFLLLCYAIDIAVFPLFRVFDGFAAWFVLRVVLGLIGASIFTASEAWINLLAPDAGRGRILGVYAASLSAGFALGPMLLAATGIAGWPPFLAAIAVYALAALPLFGVPERARGWGAERGRGPWLMAARAPLILAAAAMFGIYEAALLSLLPIWGVRLGLSDRAAAAMVSVVYVGGIAVQPAIGWLSDKVPRRALLRGCGAVGLVGAGLAIAAAPLRPALYLVLLVWGGIAAGIYPIALGMAGERFAGGDLVGLNAAIVIAYGVGALAGPPLGGAAMDLWNPNGLLALFAALFGLFLCTTLRLRRRGA